MPKKKSQRNSKPHETQSTYSVKPWVRWAAIIAIVTLLFSVMLAAMTNTPSNAAPTETASCAPIDTDSDGLTNNQDPDIDGDGIVDAQDDDMDGDGILNKDDTDMAATNCGKSTAVPIMVPAPTVENFVKGITWQWVVGILAIGFGYLTLRQVRRRK